MVENADFVSVVHRMVATSNEIAEKLMDEVAQSKDAQITMDVVQGHAIATQLRITASLIRSLLEENSTIMDHVNDLVDRLDKKK